MPKVISNTTPLITLMTIGKIELLHQLYGNVIIPQAVFEEIEQGKDKSFYVNLKNINWIIIEKVINEEPLQYITRLDKGEAEVIVLANQLKADLVIIDEYLGRQYAKHFNLKLTGTLGVLLKAKQAGLLIEIKPLLQQMQNSGIWLSNALINKLLDLAQEK